MKAVWQKLRDFLLHDVASDFRAIIDAMTTPTTPTATVSDAQSAYDDEWETYALQGSSSSSLDTSSSMSSTSGGWDDGCSYDFDSPSFNPANGLPMVSDSFDIAGNCYGTSSDDFCSGSSSSIFDDY